MALGWLWLRAWSPLVAGDAAALCVAGVALGDIHLRFAWQARHKETSIFVLRGRRGTYGTGLALVARLVAVGRRWSPVTPRHFAWQAWHLVTSTFVSRGRRGTWRHPSSFCVAGVALMALGWLWWRAWSPLVAVGRRWRRGTLRGRRGTWWHPPSFHVAGVALGDIHLRFAWQAWHLWHWAGSGGALGRRWSPLVAGDAAALCMASVALGDIHLCFAWQAWHLETSTFVLRSRRGTYGTGLALVARLVAVGRRWRRGTLRGRRGTWWHPPSFHVAGVALGDIHLRFAWQSWHLWQWAGSGGALGRRWSPVTPRHFAWQAWHLVTCTFISCGKQGTWWHPPSFRVAGVALGDIYLRFVAGVALMALGWLWWRAWSPLVAGEPCHFAWQAWHLVTCTFISCGRRRTWWHPPSFHVAGVALGDIHLRFAWQAWHLETFTFVLWQAWHLWHWAGSGGALGRRWSPVTPCRFAWQAWHLVTCTFVLRGRRGTWWHPPSFGVAGVALTALGWLWQGAWTHHLRHTIFHTHHFVTHHLWHTTLSQTIFHTPSLTHPLSHTPLCHTPFHTPLCHTPSFTHHLWHTIFDTPSFTHHFVTHHLSHTTLPHTIFVTHHLSDTIFHTQLCHIPSFTHRHRPSFTHHFVTHHLSHITLSHTIFQHTIFPTQLCHTPAFATPSFTHHFVTHHLSHTTLSHALFHTQLCHTLDKNGSLKWSGRNWILWHAIRLISYIYISDYGDHQLRLKCAQVRHHSPAGTFTQVPGGCLRWSPTPPGPRWSPAINMI